MISRSAHAIQCKSHTGFFSRLMRVLVVSGFVLLCFFLILASLTKPATHPEVKAAEIAARIRNLHFYTVFWQITCAATVVVTLATVVLVGGVRAYRQVKQASIHLYKLGEHQEIRVHERDLSLAWPTVLGLISAQQLQQTNGGLEKALELYEVMADTQATQLRALAGHRSAHVPQAAGVLEPAAAPVLPTGVPSFAQLLASGMLGSGKPLIFGFHKATGAPEHGSIQDLYSTLLLGLSGSGKTTCLCYLIGASVLAEQARFTILDPHMPSPESLGASLGPLAQSAFVRVLESPFLLDEHLAELEQTLNARLASGHTDFPARVLVTDEHERWARARKKTLLDLELRILNEGRKVHMYLFVTSKSAKADKIGDSALRDNMVTSFVFKTKVFNARLLFRDRDKEALLKELREPGDAIFTNRRDESSVVRLPYARPEDMQTVLSLVGSSQHPPNPPQGNTPRNPPQGGTLREGPPSVRVTPAWLKQRRQELGLSLQDLVDRTEVSHKMQLSRFEQGKATLSEREQDQILALLQPESKRT